MKPEIQMIRRAVLPAVLALVGSAAVAWTLDGAGAAASAALGIAIVFANFVAHGWSLAWASGVSIPMVQAVALGGLVVRMAVIVGLLFLLHIFAWFSVTTFAWTVALATMALLAFEARLAIRGVGAVLQIPADPAAVRAAQMLTLKETR
jgi:hypothetical protein